MEPPTLLDLLAGLLQYPGEDYSRRVTACAQALQQARADAAALLAAFARRTEPLSLEALQELYTATFDLNPVASLEVGWHLYGEAYERGAFLVRMRQALRRHDLRESVELPDHLSHVLPVLARMSPEAAGEFAGACVLPAVNKMRAGLEAKQNPFALVLQAVTCLLAIQPDALFRADPAEATTVTPQTGGGV